MTTTSTPTFRKTKQGQWVAFGPTTALRVGTVQVAKRDGSTKTVIVEKIGRAFEIDGVECAYGYIADDTAERDEQRVADEHDRWMVDQMRQIQTARRRGWVVKANGRWECGACGETEMLDWDRRCCNECGNHA